MSLSRLRQKNEDLEAIIKLLNDLIEKFNVVKSDYPYLNEHLDILGNINIEFELAMHSEKSSKKEFTLPYSVSQRRGDLHKQVSGYHSEHAARVAQHEEKVQELKWLKEEKYQEIIKTHLNNTESTIDRIFQENPQLQLIATQIESTNQQLATLNSGCWAGFFSCISPCCKGAIDSCCKSCCNRREIHELSNTLEGQIANFKAILEQHSKVKTQVTAVLQEEQKMLAGAVREELKRAPQEDPKASKARHQLAHLEGQVLAQKQYHKGHIQQAAMLQYIRFYYCVQEINRLFIKHPTPKPSPPIAEGTQLDAKAQAKIAFKALCAQTERELDTYRNKLHYRNNTQEKSRFANKFIMNYRSRNRFTDLQRKAILRGPEWTNAQTSSAAHSAAPLKYDDIMVALFSVHRSPKQPTSPSSPPLSPSSRSQRYHIDTSPSPTPPSSSSSTSPSPYSVTRTVRGSSVPATHFSAARRPPPISATRTPQPRAITSSHAATAATPHSPKSGGS